MNPFNGMRALVQENTENISVRNQPKQTKASIASRNYLEVIFTTVQELGDYLTQQSTFQSFRESHSVSKSLQLIQDFAKLNGQT